jgi:predicted MPP superfamily phosphohydrolase
MRMWRPGFKCLYVIPEIHGNADSLEIVLNRIVPLRKFKGQEDQIVFMGDYIDGDNGGGSVLNILINLKKEYNDRITFLKGNHESLMLKALLGNDTDFTNWIDAGGISTIQNYLSLNNMSASPYSIQRTRLADLVPKEHIEFLQSLLSFKVIENYFFMHGGFNIEKSINENSELNFIYDYIASKKAKDAWKNNTNIDYKDDYTYVAAHNYNDDKPFLCQKYFMLGGSAPARLMVFELNSMSASAVKRNKSRIYKYDFKVV